MIMTTVIIKMASMMAKVKMTMMASCKSKAISNDTAMAVLMEYCNSHHDGAQLWPS